MSAEQLVAVAIYLESGAKFTRSVGGALELSGSRQGGSPVARAIASQGVPPLTARIRRLVNADPCDAARLLCWFARKPELIEGAIRMLERVRRVADEIAVTDG